jgi:hypothetical protein
MEGHSVNGAQAVCRYVYACVGIPGSAIDSPAPGGGGSRLMELIKAKRNDTNLSSGLMWNADVW